MTAEKLLLWPENAVFFESPEAREAAFDKIREIKGPVIGVPFEELVVRDADSPTGRTGFKRNGLAFVSSSQEHGDEVVQYYKRNLVPSTCSQPFLQHTYDLHEPISRQSPNRSRPFRPWIHPLSTISTYPIPKVSRSPSGRPHQTISVRCPSRPRSASTLRRRLYSQVCHPDPPS